MGRRSFPETSDDAEAVVGAELRNSPEMKTIPGGVADSMSVGLILACFPKLRRRRGRDEERVVNDLMKYGSVVRDDHSFETQRNLTRDLAGNLKSISLVTEAIWESTMTTIRRFSCNDLLRFTSVNLDHLTETFNMSFYMTYLARWPDYFHVAEGPGNRVMVMGKVEGQGESWHGHVTAVTVSPEYRRQQLAKKLMNLLEEISDKIDKAYFVDLFVRASNTPAIKMYEKLGYIIYRRVLRYYSGEEDGLDMRKALSRDVEKKSVIPLKRPITPDELEYD
ncbi:hypothetical protein IGI04_039295 [Brassica rapa subsp. trilocularis]|uniref:N-acetyltransferase domain-containing protein n=1 Tax=Brassica rapa subsp. trilocularis TaxID=1813537 RepID=A0ABQ7KN73_BRACM|nr:hypothetical protein IGI04_039295 [Brassica rapa subsp. trilocularis]